jgi:hypothetical protein
MAESGTAASLSSSARTRLLMGLAKSTLAGIRFSRGDDADFLFANSLNDG